SSGILDSEQSETSCLVSDRRVRMQTGKTHLMIFSVNLRDASGHDIILHLNPRLAKRVFVRNSFLSECWGAEELDLEAFPFAAGEYFEMIVRSDARHFRVAVNGSHQFDYKHRVQDLSAVGQLEFQKLNIYQ
uniref:Galectin n=1 Tax=Poecilia reticulata TaxID=8081 RepID=A0A3P9PIV8_POERE